jgi:integrase
MEDEADHRGAADPAQAFEDLRAEVSVLRRAVEALPGAWEDSRPPDYAPSLGTIAKGLAAVDNRLAGIETHPALRLTPEQHQQAVAQAGNMLMREAVQKLDRALIGLMVFSFARIGAALGMKVDDVFTQNRRLWVRLREKGGKAHAMPCHHNLETYITAYIDGVGIAEDPKGPLFRTIGRGTGLLTRTPLPQANAYAMIGRRAAAAGIATKLGNHSFRATGITAYLKNGGTLEKAAQMANHASTRTTQLYDRRHEELSLDEVERIRV